MIRPMRQSRKLAKIARAATGYVAAGCMLALVTAGCAQNTPLFQSQLQTLQQQQLAASQRAQELQSRAATLDKDNQELQSATAHWQQQIRVLDDQVAVLKEQLATATEQTERLKSDRDEVAHHAEALSASVRRKAGASISANNSLKGQLPEINLPGVQVRQDGDVVRIELPGGKLFERGNARLLTTATGMIDSVAAEIARTYPGHIVGVEGHTDNDPVRSQGWRNNHQLSVGRAMAVYEYLVGRTRLTSDQLFVTGHGANHPVVSNGTPAGKERNRRVELVVYPERASGG